MLIRLLGIFLLTSAAMSVAAQDTAQINLLLAEAEHVFLKPGRTKQDLDSSLFYSQTAETLSKKLNYSKGIGNSYEQTSRILHVTGEVEKAKAIAGKAIDIFTANNYFPELGEAWFDLAGYYSLGEDQLPQRISIVEKSLVAFQQAQNKAKEASIFEELGDLRQIQGNYPAALANVKQALDIYRSIHYPQLQGAYDLLGNISAEMGNMEQAIQYGLMAVKTAEEVHDTSLQLATIYNRLGLSYDLMGKYQEEYDCYQRSLAVAERYKSDETVVNLRCNMAALLVNMDRPGEAVGILKVLKSKQPHSINSTIRIAARFVIVYDALKQYDKARPYADELVKLSEKFDRQDDRQTLIYVSLIRFYLATKQYARALKYLAINKEFTRARIRPLSSAYNEMYWFQLDSTQEHYLDAIKHYQQYKILQDSILSQSTRHKVEQLQIQYETEKKDQNIAALTTEAKLQKASLRQAEITRNWILSSVVMLILLLALGYNRYRLKQKSNRKLELQQAEIREKNNSLQHLADEREWLIKEIHHRVKNNFHMVNGLLGTQMRYLKNEEAMEAISESRRRVEAMALIHQRLYRSENISAIDMEDYIHELADYLRDSFNLDRTIQFKFDIDPIELDLKHSIPIGLILNEAITNAIKYAFGEDQNGVIRISLTSEEPGWLVLAVSDNGVGMPSAFNIRTGKSMGMHLMQGLSQELDGSFEIISHPGTEVRVSFNHENSPV